MQCINTLNAPAHWPSSIHGTMVYTLQKYTQLHAAQLTSSCSTWSVWLGAVKYVHDACENSKVVTVTECPLELAYLSSGKGMVSGAE